MKCPLLPPPGTIQRFYPLLAPPPCSLPAKMPARYCPDLRASSVSISVEPTASRSMLTLNLVYKLQLLGPLFHRFDRHAPTPLCSNPWRFFHLPLSVRPYLGTPRSSLGQIGCPPVPSRFAMGPNSKTQTCRSLDLSLLVIIGVPMVVRPILHPLYHHPTHTFFQMHTGARRPEEEPMVTSLAAKKRTLSNKALRRVPTSRDCRNIV